MTEKSIQKAIRLKRHYCKAIIPNIFWNSLWESDMLEITKSEKVIEYEIKVSRSDFKADFNKIDKHKMLDSAADLSITPNYFAYVCPEGIINVEDVPNYAGLYYIKEYGLNKVMVAIKKPPMIHNERIEISRWKDLAIKLYHRARY